MTGPLKQDRLIQLYWILHAVQHGDAVNSEHLDACFIAIRDALLQPDTEQIVDHIRGALQRQQAAATALADRAIDDGRRQPLDHDRMVQLLAPLAARHGLPGAEVQDLALDFGRLVEAAHGIAP